MCIIYVSILLCMCIMYIVVSARLIYMYMLYVSLADTTIYVYYRCCSLGDAIPKAKELHKKKTALLSLSHTHTC